jgi:hypothetical protein
MDALLSQVGIKDAFTVIEEYTIFVLGSDKSSLEHESLKKMIKEEFGYGLVKFEENPQGDWAGLKAKHKVTR